MKDIDIQTFEYVPPSNRIRKLNVIFGPEDKKNKVIFYIHQDVWSTKNGEEDFKFLNELSKKGFTIVVPTLEFGHIGGMKAIMEDICLALRWVKDNLDMLGSNNGLALLASGFGAQIGLLSYSCIYSSAFRSLLDFEEIDINIKGMALISPITDIREVYIEPNDQGTNASYRQSLLSLVYGPNYQNSTLLLKTASSIDSARTLSSCKAKIMIQSFAKDNLFIANQKIVDNLKLSYLEPINKIYSAEDHSFDEYIEGENIGKYIEEISDISSFLSNLWNYE